MFRHLFYLLMSHLSNNPKYSIAYDSTKTKITHCKNLEQIEIPAGVKSVDRYAFSGCSKLQYISVALDNQYLTSVNGVVFTKNMDTIVRYPNGRDGAFVIPDTVKTIAEGAFGNCKLTSVKIPDGVTSIGEEAFCDCNGLTSIEIPGSVTSIGDYAFSSCESLASIHIADGVKTIGEEAFIFCEALTSIEIPGSVTSIGHEAFAIFALPRIDVSPENPNFKSVDGVLYDKNMETLLRCPAGIKASAFIIPDTVKTIVESAFADCESLTSIDIPGSVTRIDYYAFTGGHLKEIHLRNENPKTISIDKEIFDTPFGGVLYVPAVAKRAYSHDDLFKEQFPEIKAEE